MTTLDLKLSGAGEDSKGSFKKVFFLSKNETMVNQKCDHIINISCFRIFMLSSNPPQLFFMFSFHIKTVQI